MCLHIAILTSHAEEQPNPIEASDKQFVGGHNQDKGGHADNQIFCGDAHIPLHNVRAYKQYQGLVQYIERQDCFVTVPQHLALKIQIFCTNTHNKYYPAQVLYAHYELEEQV
jgi:hypothetical protein